MTYEQIIERRRNLRIDGYKTFADVGFDGPWVTPYQKASRSPDGPVLVALHWLNESAIAENRETLSRFGYLPTLRFNKVLEIALTSRGLSRSRIYVTQAFHLVPQGRSERIPRHAMDRSFDQVTRHELAGRKVLALGSAASDACARHGISHQPVCHPSRRGCSNEHNAAEIAAGLVSLGF